MGACAVLLPVAWLLHPALGSLGLPIASVIVAMIVGWCSSLLREVRTAQRLLALASGVTVLFLVIAAVTPATAATTRPVANVGFVQEAGSGKARWVVSHLGELSPQLEQAFPEKGVAAPWEGKGFFPSRTSVASVIAQDAPTVELLEEERMPTHRRLRVRIQTSGRVELTRWLFPPATAVSGLMVNGARIDKLQRPFVRLAPDWRALELFHIPAEGIEVELQLPLDAPFRSAVVGLSYGVPDAGRRLLEVRDRVAQPFHQGDLTQLWRWVEL